MKHFQTRLRQLREILESYSYPSSFQLHLKKYFSKHPYMGSKDRKEIKTLCYGFFRLSHAMKGFSFEEIAQAAADLKNYQADLNKNKIFPFTENTPELFNNRLFQLSFLSQPKVWIKIS